jgi:hypothetical protein
MKQTIASAIALLFAGSLQAASDAEVYHGFAAGNPDLSTESFTAQNRSPDSGIGFDKLVYNGFEVGNPELSTDGRSGSSAEVAMIGSQPAVGSGTRGYGSDSDPFRQWSIYNGFEVGNPDL